MKTKTTKKIEKKTIKIESPSAYSVSIKIFGKTHTSSGQTIQEALTNLRPQGRMAGMSLLTVCHGDVKKERILGNIQTLRLFSQSRIMREVALRNMCLLFDNL